MSIDNRTSGGSRFGIALMCILFLAAPLIGFAQQATAVRHRVQPQETFYSLSKKYDVSIEEIKAANPAVPYPKAGEFMLIPVEDNGRGYFIHKVTEPKSTLAKLTSLFGVELKQLEALNPQIEDRVWQGQEIKIPVEFYQPSGKTGKKPAKVHEPEPEPDVAVSELVPGPGDCRQLEKYLKSTWKVALMIPLSLNKLPGPDELAGLTIEEQLQLEPFRFIQFYQGVMLAMDSLQRTGLMAELFVYDVDQDINKAKLVISQPALKDMDLIIGPFFKSSFSAVADFARTNDIPLVNPLSARSDILTGHPEVFKVLPPRSSIPSELALLVKSHFSDNQVLIIHQGMAQQMEMVEAMKVAIEKSTDRKVVSMNYATDSISGFVRKASLTGPNLVIIYAENEAMPLEVISRLHERRTTYDMTLVGLPEWDEFDHIENLYMMDLNAHLFSETFTDYSDSLTWGFIRSFRGRYSSEPLELAFQGFDVTWYFMHALMEYGPGFRDCLDQMNLRLNHARFRFSKVDGGGYENTRWNIYRIADFEAVPVLH